MKFNITTQKPDNVPAAILTTIFLPFVALLVGCILGFLVMLIIELLFGRVFCWVFTGDTWEFSKEGAIFGIRLIAQGAFWLTLIGTPAYHCLSFEEKE